MNGANFFLHCIISTALEVHSSELAGLDWNTWVINHFPENFHVWQQRWLAKSINLMLEKFTAPLHTELLSCESEKCELVWQNFADWGFLFSLSANIKPQQLIYLIKCCNEPSTRRSWVSLKEFSFTQSQKFCGEMLPYMEHNNVKNQCNLKCRKPYAF